MKKSKLTPLLCAVIGIGERQHVRAGAAPAEPAAQTPGRADRTDRRHRPLAGRWRVARQQRKSTAIPSFSNLPASIR